MAVTVKQEVAALYSAIFNRAPDQAGLEFWVNAIEGGDSLVQAAEGFTQHPVFAETYAGMSDSQFVQQLYVNILGGAGDANGIAFWTEKLASGVSKGQVVAEFVQGALSIDLDALLASGELSQAEYDAAVVRQDSLTNKANVGLYFVEKFGAATNLSADTDTTTKEGLESDPVYLASQAAIANVTADAASVTAANAAINAAGAPTDLNVAPAFTLTAGLEALQDAKDAKEAFLEEALENATLAENQSLDENSTTADAEAAIGAELNAKTALVASEVSDTSFATRSVTVQDNLIADAVAAKATVLSNAVKAAVAGTQTLLATVEVQVDATNAAIDAATGAQDVLDDAITVFEALNTTLTFAAASTTTGNDVFVSTDGTKLIKYVDGTSNVTLAEKKSGSWTLTTEGKAVKSVTELLAAFEADKAADLAVDAAKEQLEAAVAAVYVAENKAYSAYNPEAALAYSLDGDGKSVITVDFDASVKVFATKALAEADAAGVKEKFTVTVGAAGTDAQTLTFDGVTYTVDNASDASDADAATTAANFAAAYSNATNTLWVVERDGAVLTFTAKAAAADIDNATAVAGTVTKTVAQVTPGIAPNVGAGAISKDAQLADNVYEAQIAVKEFNTLVAEFLNARELSTDLKAADAAIDAAEAALTDSVEEGGLGVTLLGGADNFTTKNDVYLFDAKHGDEDLTNFGQTGEDKIFFGEGFSLVAIAEGKTISNNIGDASALEILWAQNGNDLVLYVEKETFGGNSAGTSDLVEITLTGVNAENVTFEGGFLIAGTAV